MSIILFGQYPRSEALVRATREFDRKRISEGALFSALEKDRQSLEELQEGFLFKTSGLFHWDDLIRPYAELVDNCQIGPLTRFFETNTFWRKLEARGTIRVLEELLDNWIRKYFFPDNTFSLKEPVVFTLPFLFLFRSFSKGIEFNEIRDLLRRVVIELDKKYQGIVVFFEPNIGWRTLEDEEKMQALEFLEDIKSCTSIPLAIVQSFFSVERDKKFLYSLPVDSIGIDFYHNRISDIGRGFPENKTLFAGVISTDSTSLEPKQHIIQFMNEVSQYLPKSNVSFTTSGPAELLPRGILDKKVIHMKGAEKWY